MSLTEDIKAIQRMAGTDDDGVFGPESARMTRALLEGLRAKPKSPAKPQPERGIVFDERTEKNLATLEPQAQEKMRSFLAQAFTVAASMGVEAKVICGRRGKAAQEAAKAKGASKAGFGFSWHNFGTAIDLGLFIGSKYLDSADAAKANAVYSAIGALASSFGIEWGGNWKSFKDTPHFHIDLGRTTPNSNDRQLLFSGNWKF